MGHRTGWTALLAMALGASACAYGVVDEDGDDDQVATSASYQSGTPTGAWSGTGSPTGTGTAPSGGLCYSGVGECNPMGSDCALGETCDATEAEGFVCFPPPNDAGLGSSCDAVLGPYCATGSTCVDGVCRAFCCDDSDCGVGSCASTGAASGVLLRACLP